tara:strand:+ start:238 stop:348 length:111 start_codon:yes stop_codon:yes gene_type:complete
MKKFTYACIYILAATTITSLAPLYITTGLITRKIKS